MSLIPSILPQVSLVGPWTTTGISDLARSQQPPAATPQPPAATPPSPPAATTSSHQQPPAGPHTVRLSGVPWAAPASWARAGPRSTCATPTAMTAPATGPIRYTHQVDRLPMARSGPKLRAGFIEAPSNGPPMVPQAMMYAPTASGMNGPLSLGPLARFKIISTRPKVMMTSNPAACQDWPGLGMVAARCPAGPKNPRASSEPHAAAANWTSQ